MRLSRASSRLEPPTPAMFVRSWPRRNLAYVQPPFSSPTRFSTGTSASSNQTSFTSWLPSSSVIGRTVTPGLFMSISKNEMPVCFFTVGSVRTRQKIQLA